MTAKRTNVYARQVDDIMSRSANQTEPNKKNLNQTIGYYQASNQEPLIFTVCKHGSPTHKTVD